MFDRKIWLFSTPSKAGPVAKPKPVVWTGSVFRRSRSGRAGRWRRRNIGLALFAWAGSAVGTTGCVALPVR
jgi:hypothetical protein